ncbi:MAG: hypothetical protein AABX78_00420, partial [Nanoarchaeota archaeon]
MALTYLNYFAMVVGYISLFFIVMVTVIFTYIYLRDKYNNWKWRKEREERQKQQEGKNKEPQTTPEAANIPENEKTD